MLECIFKIYSNIIGDRMACVLREIQDPNQYGFTSGKSCMEPTRTIIDATRHANVSGNPIIILSTDIYKEQKPFKLVSMNSSLHLRGGEGDKR